MSKDIQNKMLKRTSNKSWWRWFWTTIVVLLIVYLGIFYLTANTDIKTKEGRVNYLHQMRETLNQFSPELEKYIANLSESSKKKIKEKINEEVARAYQPIYDKGIDNFTDYHYSVLGEYSEMFASASDKISNEKKDKFRKLIYEKLFASVGFDGHLKEAYKNVNSFALDEINKNIDSIHDKIQNDLNVSNAQADFLIAQMFQMGVSDMKERFSSKLGNSFRTAGVGGSAVAGALVMKQVTKMFTKKVATKLAAKGASKIAGSAAGAVAGGESGLLCGPGAFLCSPVGAVFGGIVGWFATDGAVAAIDEHFNAEDFKNHLKGIVKNQQVQTQNQLYSVYTTTIDEVNIQNKESLDKFKHRKNGDNL